MGKCGFTLFSVEELYKNLCESLQFLWTNYHKTQCIKFLSNRILQTKGVMALQAQSVSVQAWSTFNSPDESSYQKPQSQKTWNKTFWKWIFGIFHHFGSGIRCGNYFLRLWSSNNSLKTKLTGVHQRVRVWPPQQEALDMAHSDTMSPGFYRHRPASRVSSTCGHRFDDLAIKSILKLPKVSCFQVHIWTPLCLNMAFVMDSLWRAQKSNNKTTLRFRCGGPFFPITAPRSHCRCQHEHWSHPGGWGNHKKEPFPLLPLRTTTMVDTLNRCLGHRQNPHSESILPPQSEGWLPSRSQMYRIWLLLSANNIYTYIYIYILSGI